MSVARTLRPAAVSASRRPLPLEAVAVGASAYWPRSIAISCPSLGAVVGARGTGRAPEGGVAVTGGGEVPAPSLGSIATIHTPGRGLTWIDHRPLDSKSNFAARFLSS